MAEEMHLN